MELPQGNVHDFVVVKVDNPYFGPTSPAEHREIDAIKTLRGDTVGRMYERGQLGDRHEKPTSDQRPHERTPAHLLLAAARQFQRDYETAGPRLKSSGHLEEPVDGGGKMPVGITDRQMLASERLTLYRALLGKKQYRVVEGVLINKLSMWGVICQEYPDKRNDAGRKFVGTLFRNLLQQLAEAMGLAS